MKLSTSGANSINIFQLTAVFSMLFALIGFSYNVWRMEITEHNNNVRSAGFELLLQLSELESIIYAAHYDQNVIEGSPRKGWVKVNLIADLSVVTNTQIQTAAEALKTSWQHNWPHITDDEPRVTAMVAQIDNTRLKVRQLLSTLE
ncbi:hypothetical protein [Shewanella youngdeokensis]|uniref:Uncharacterized protein n=1 Tax=Shewanella youngdeokensis TaxID=2999068 RepID=A0ABZ0JV58_9GAMM|nr:hypothetical protein RGE70_12730 [Shewanella sp. DAU334]